MILFRAVTYYFVVVFAQRTFTVAASTEFPPLFESAFGYLLESLEWDSNEPTDRANVLQEYDFIVVGAGSAGSVVASRLSEIKEWRVLLIEAGQSALHTMDIPLLAMTLQATDINWKYRTVPSNNSCLAFVDNSCKFPRGKVMGGSSVLNYLIYTRGHRNDYDNWARMGNTGWSYDEVLKYFIKSENVNVSNADMGYRGRDGLLPVTDVPYRTPTAKAFVNAGSQIGLPVIDVNGKQQVGINFIQVTMRDGHRCSTNAAFLFPAKNRRNLHVKKRGFVTRIIIDDRSKTAVGVEFVSNGKRRRVFARKEVIVSGGAINSPQLLMLSGIGPAEHLRDKKIAVVKDLPVGENLMDHVALGSLSVLINDTVSLNLQRVVDDPRNLDDFMRHQKGIYTIPGGTEAVAFLDTRRMGSADGYPDLELMFNSGLYSSNAMVPTLLGLKPEVYDRVYRATEGTGGFLIFPMIMRPKSKGRVWLKDSNPLRHPLIDPNYFADEADLDVAVAGVRVVEKMLRTAAMRKLNATLLRTPLPGCERHEFGTDDYWKCSARQISFTVYHLSGTCKMGPAADPTAVVDPRLRVHGIRNLRVVDASIMPEVPAAHTNAPAIMIGEKGADMIKEDWGFMV